MHCANAKCTRHRTCFLPSVVYKREYKKNGALIPSSRQEKCTIHHIPLDEFSRLFKIVDRKNCLLQSLFVHNKHAVSKRMNVFIILNVAHPKPMFGLCNGKSDNDNLRLLVKLFLAYSRF